MHRQDLLRCLSASGLAGLPMSDRSEPRPEALPRESSGHGAASSTIEPRREGRAMRVALADRVHKVCSVRFCYTPLGLFGTEVHAEVPPPWVALLQRAPPPSAADAREAPPKARTTTTQLMSKRYTFTSGAPRVEAASSQPLELEVSATCAVLVHSRALTRCSSDCMFVSWVSPISFSTRLAGTTTVDAPP